MKASDLTYVHTEMFSFEFSMSVNRMSISPTTIFYGFMTAVFPKATYSFVREATVKNKSLKVTVIS